METDWRILLYPLGFLSFLAFGARMVIQWVKSEIAKESVTPCSFWQLSLVGNISLWLHAFIQFQYHVCMAQACNAFISWRNLNLMTPLSKPHHFSKVIALLAGMLLFTTATFFAQSYLFFQGTMDWFRIPLTPWDKTPLGNIHILWHLLGFLGILLFSSRFWVQWWKAETHQSSSLNPSFWWLSMIGALLSLLYFIRIRDLVNIIGSTIGLFFYIRNISLIKKSTSSFLGDQQT